MAIFGRVHRATAIIPLAVLSVAWTASLTGMGAGSASSGPDGSSTLPDGTVLPARAVEAPASVGIRLTPGTAGTAGSIPPAALTAYQRAAVVINQADSSCHVAWELIAAIGRVESDHGRHGGSALGTDGVARPGIYGVALDGTSGTPDISDTDGGAYDRDTHHDRAVGPMQFIPSTWSVVGVDGDGDGTRNPQDIDDASLATAVYLCSGDDDLSTESGQRASVHRYNHSDSYVDLVLSIMQAYSDRDFTSVPDSALIRIAAPPAPGATEGPSTGGGHTGHGGESEHQPSISTPTPSPLPTPTPVLTPTPTPTQTPTQTAVPPLPSISASPITGTLTWAQAQARCLAQGVSPRDLVALNACINAAMDP